jgi:hypothetical protein
MSTLTAEITETLRTMDDKEAAPLAEALQRLLLRRRVMAARPPRDHSIPRDAKGWPIGYWESVVGAWADLDFEAPDDPPPEPHPY